MTLAPRVLLLAALFQACDGGRARNPSGGGSSNRRSNDARVRDATDGGAVADGTAPTDLGPRDFGFDDSGQPLDGGFIDVGFIDVGFIDVGFVDSGPPDTGLHDAGRPPCIGSGFNASVVNWSIPYQAERTTEATFSSRGNFYTFDIDGDARPDLVRTYTGAAGVGTSHWQVFRNNGNGFNASASNWSIPFQAERTTEATFSSRGNFYTFDLDGDARPDLVRTYTGAAGVGTSHWNVYRNNGNGFDASPMTWSIPFMAERTTEATFSSRGNFYTFDIDGDARPDLIRTYTGSAGIGTTHWQVFRNNGGGFNASATTWSIPFMAERTTEATFSSRGNFYTFDIDGDTRPDLVRTYTGSDGIGTSHWHVYRNDGSGFIASASTWPIPFVAERTTEATFSSRGNFYTFDIDGDLRPDLVRTYTGAAGIGTSHWVVHANGGSGFSASATQWPLPFTAERLAEATFSSRGNFYTFDIDGDARVDLVRTYNSGSGVGTSHWELFTDTCP